MGKGHVLSIGSLITQGRGADVVDLGLNPSPEWVSSTTSLQNGHDCTCPSRCMLSGTDGAGLSAYLRAWLCGGNNYFSGSWNQ